jgi:hypothetical protein
MGHLVQQKQLYARELEHYYKIVAFDIGILSHQWQNVSAQQMLDGL